MSPRNQYSLLRQRRFGPFFATQFLGAFNDSFLKQAVLVLIVFSVGTNDAKETATLANLSAFAFILPFFLFSATAGHLADRFDKTFLIRWIKASEVLVAGTAVAAFYFKSLELLLIVLFLMGVQSSMFAPVKYSILPDNLAEPELIGGNGLVNGGTFVAILLGTIVGGLPGSNGTQSFNAGWIMILIAAIGIVCSFGIPVIGTGDKSVSIKADILEQTRSVFRYASQNRIILLLILGVSWFWFFGFLFITQLPVLTRFYMSGNQAVVNLLLVILSVGIGSGSLLCEKLSARRIEIGLVPLGALGMTIFGLGLYIALPEQSAHQQLLGIQQFASRPDRWPILINLFMLGAAAGLYVVPLLAQIQMLSAPEQRSRILSASSIFNAIFMSVASVIAVLVLRTTTMGVAELLFGIAILNAAVSLFVFTQVPEFLLRFVVWCLINIAFRMRSSGLDQVPRNGPAVLVCNHVSYADAGVLLGCVDRPLRFVMYYRIYRIPIMRFFFRISRAIPVAGKKEDEAMMERAFETVKAELEAGHLVCIFPEGGLTPDGEIAPFRPGIERIIATTPVPVVPLAISGLWDSSFSRQKGNWFYRLRTAFRRRVALTAEAPIPPSEVTAAYLEERVKKMRGSNR